MAIGLAGTIARRRTASIARKSIAQDINNSQLINRYKNDLIDDERQKLATIRKILPALEQVSKIEDFEKVAAKRAEIRKETAIKPAAAALRGKKTNSLK
jgi:tellurite resistance protein